MLLFSPYIITIEYSFIILNTVLERYYESLLEFLFDKIKLSDVLRLPTIFFFTLLSSPIPIDYYLYPLTSTIFFVWLSNWSTKTRLKF